MLCCVLLWLGSRHFTPIHQDHIIGTMANHTIAPVPVNQPWRIWANVAYQHTRIDDINTTQQSMTDDEKMVHTVFKIRSETCRTKAQFCQNFYMIKKENLPDRPEFCRSRSTVQHLFWRLCTYFIGHIEFVSDLEGRFWPWSSENAQRRSRWVWTATCTCVYYIILGKKLRISDADSSGVTVSDKGWYIPWYKKV